MKDNEQTRSEAAVKFRPKRKKKQPLVSGKDYRVQAGDTWSSLALKHYGDAMLGSALAECNGYEHDDKPPHSKSIVLPDPDELNRRLNVVQTAANPYSRKQKLHIMPTRTQDEDDEDTKAKDARARLIRARTGLGLHAKGGGWKPVAQNKDDQDKKKKSGKKMIEPELEDHWLRRLARLPPRAAMKVAEKCDVGAGPALSLLGGLRESQTEAERMNLVQRFLQAYGTPGYATVKLLLRLVAFKAAQKGED